MVQPEKTLCRIQCDTVRFKAERRVLASPRLSGMLDAVCQRTLEVVLRPWPLSHTRGVGCTVDFIRRSCGYQAHVSGGANAGTEAAPQTTCGTASFLTPEHAVEMPKPAFHRRGAPPVAIPKLAAVCTSKRLAAGAHAGAALEVAGKWQTTTSLSAREFS